MIGNSQKQVLNFTVTNTSLHVIERHSKPHYVKNKQTEEYLYQKERLPLPFCSSEIGSNPHT